MPDVDPTVTAANLQAVSTAQLTGRPAASFLGKLDCMAESSAPCHAISFRWLSVTLLLLAVLLRCCCVAAAGGDMPIRPPKSHERIFFTGTQLPDVMVVMLRMNIEHLYETVECAKLVESEV